MEQAGYDVLLPVIEKAALLAATYMKECGRSTLTAMDIQYAMKYCAVYQVGVDTGTIFSDSDSESETDSELEMVDEDDEPFTRYTGDNELLMAVNECFDTWESWEPTSPAQIMLKDAINKNMY